MTEIHEIPLTGLIGSNPLGAMAAFGLLRVCSEIKELEKSRLFWRMKDDWIAVLAFKGENSISEDKLASLLLSHLMHFPSENVFGWNKNINEEKDKFRGRLQKHVENSSISRRLLVDFFSAFASDMVTDSQEKWVKPTAFYMVKSGFLDSMNKKIAGSLKKPRKSEKSAELSFKEALFGPWEYEDIYHAMGWDPATERMHALQHYNPGKAVTKEAKPKCVRAAIWLAGQALPLFPVFPTAKGKLLTTGFSPSEREREPCFTWPVWEQPVSFDTLYSLLASSELADWSDKDRDKLSKRGIAAVFKSVRSPYGQGSAVFRPATLAWMAD